MESKDKSQNAQPQVIINAQYVKDLSFENPNAPASFTSAKTSPNIDLALDIKVKKVEEDHYEVALEIKVKALADKETLFIAELSYAGLFTVQNLNDETQKEQILLIYCPSLLFPFARRVVADITRDGGFQPLMINPIDFAALYMQQKQQKPAN